MIITPVVNGGVWLWSMTLVQLIVLTLTFLWFWRMNQLNQWEFRRTQLDAPIWILLGMAVISTYFSIYLYASLLQIAQIICYIGVSIL